MAVQALGLLGLGFGATKVVPEVFGKKPGDNGGARPPQQPIMIHAGSSSSTSTLLLSAGIGAAGVLMLGGYRFFSKSDNTPEICNAIDANTNKVTTQLNHVNDNNIKLAKQLDKNAQLRMERQTAELTATIQSESEATRLVAEQNQQLLLQVHKIVYQEQGAAQAKAEGRVTPGGPEMTENANFADAIQSSTDRIISRESIEQRRQNFLEQAFRRVVGDDTLQAGQTVESLDETKLAAINQYAVDTQRRKKENKKFGKLAFLGTTIAAVGAGILYTKRPNG